MPTYEYVCETCEHRFEVSQSMKDKTLTRCPASECPRKPWGKGRVKRLLGTGAGLIFKGSGFYITDYRSESYKTAAKGDVAPAAATTEGVAAKTDAKTDTKPASKPEAKPSPKPAAGPAGPKPKAGG